MFNDFVVVGPSGDPAGVAGGKDIAVGLRSIADAGALFASRGDDSGTHKAEWRLWEASGIDPKKGTNWYREMGAGMGATLNTASQLGAYTLSDRATWIAFRNKAEMKIVIEGDKRLFNQYGVILVNPARHPHVKQAEGQSFIDWLVSPRRAGRNRRLQGRRPAIVFSECRYERCLKPVSGIRGAFCAVFRKPQT